MHDERLATKADEAEVDQVEISAKLIDSSFLPPRVYGTHPDIDWIFGESETANLQLGEGGTVLYVLRHAATGWLKRLVCAIQKCAPLHRQAAAVCSV